MVEEARVFLFLGEEEFLKEEAIEKLRQKTGAPSGQIFRASDADFSLEKAIGLCRTASLFSSRQIIIIKDIERINPEERKILLSYLVCPSSHTYLVLTSRKKQRSFPEPEFLAQLLAKQPNLAWRDFRPLSEEELRRKIFYWAKEKGKIISSRALDFLLAKFGHDLGRLYQTVEKACIYIKDKPNLDSSDLEKIVGGEIVFDVYKLLEATLNKDTASAIKILRVLSQFKVKPEAIIAILAKELIKIYQAKKFIHLGLSLAQIRTKLGIKYYADNFFAQARNLKLEELEQRLRKLLNIDLAIKTGRLKPYYALETWVLETLQPT